MFSKKMQKTIEQPKSITHGQKTKTLIGERKDEPSSDQTSEKIRRMIEGQILKKSNADRAMWQ